MSRTVPNGSSGILDYESGGADAALVTLSDFSLGLWCRFGANGGGNGILCQRGRFTGVTTLEADNVNFYIYIGGASGSWDVGYIHQFSTGTLESSPLFLTNIADGAWVYLGFTRDATAKTVDLYLMAAGAISLFGTYTYTNAPTGGNGSGCRLTQLARFNPDSPLIAQTLDDVWLANFTFYHSKLNLAQHAQNALTGPVWSMSPLIWAPLWGVNSPEPDWSGAVRNPAIVGTVNGDVLHAPIRFPFPGLSVGESAAAVPLVITGNSLIPSDEEFFSVGAVSGGALTHEITGLSLIPSAEEFFSGGVISGGSPVSSGAGGSLFPWFTGAGGWWDVQ